MTPQENSFDDETLMRRVDGELTPEQGAAIDAAAATDPVLADRLAALRGLRTLTREAFPAQADPRDDALAVLIAGPPVAAGAPSWTARLKAAFAPSLLPVWAAGAAAAFVLGLMVGGPGSSTGFVVGPQGQIADATLTRVLDQRLAGQGADADGRAVGLTFRDDQGRWCRTFSAGDAGVAGLACRQDDRWAVQALAPFTATGPDAIRTASADIPAPVLAAVDAAQAGDVLDAAAEARARDAGWR
ncbi:hypothetical protein [Brevundimonas sp. GCM10030266]|uniref:hypothetical protein n=1 Tax=Brevundimonas sp. GCM10030266 TaxID=3273386 RepID=UPI003617A21D